MASYKANLKVTKLPSEELGLTNKVYVNPEEYKRFKEVMSSLGDYVLVKDFVFTLGDHNSILKGLIGVGNVPRNKFLLLALNDPVELVPYKPTDTCIYLNELTVEVDYLSKSKKGDEFQAEEMTKALMRLFVNQFFTIDQVFVSEVNGITLQFKVKQCEVVDLAKIAMGEETSATKGDDVVKAKRGILQHKTVVNYEKANGSGLKILGGATQTPSLFRPKWNFESMGIGGLDNQFSDIFRRAFASRVFPADVIAKLGIRHVKGILLYGPPGTGKTLMARQIGKMLNGREPKIVNGPEVLNKYVGQSEENIRKLFKDAEDEYAEKGEASELHIIIFDEIDAICKQRGSKNDGTGVADTVVNQLLSKIEGVTALNNILIIGMTNRKDLIDEALLRPGRLEIHMEISLPDEKGRVQILKIHTAAMTKNGSLGSDVDINQIASQTKNFSGAEIEGLVKSATSFALNRQVDVTEGVKVNSTQIVVMKQDFDRALEEIKPAFGIDNDEFSTCIRNGIISYSPAVEKVIDNGDLMVQQVRNSTRTPLVSVLLEGTVGSGKTALAAKIATESGYPYVKMISPEMLVGYSETGKCSKITKVFEDSYRSPISCIVVDDIERLLDYVRIGPRFSNAVLQTLLVLLKKEPPAGKRLLILCTTSNKRVLEDMELLDVYHAQLHVPQISTPSEFKKVLHELQAFNETDLETVSKAFTTPISVKKLIMVTEMAKQNASGSIVDRFLNSLHDAQ